MTGEAKGRQGPRGPRTPPPVLPRQAAPAPAPDRVRVPRAAVRAGEARGATDAARSAAAAHTAAGVHTGAAAVRGMATGPSAPLSAVMDRATADRQLVAGAVAVVLLARMVDGPIAWLVAGVLGAGVLTGVSWSRAAVQSGRDALGHDARFRPRWEAVVSGAAALESGIVPAVLASSLALAVRLVPFDWRMAGALAIGFVLLERSIRLERSVARSADPDGSRWQIVMVSLATAFLGFAGVASMIQGGVARVGVPMLAELDLLLLAAGDAMVALPLGFRLARLGPASRRESALSGAGFAAVVAIGAGLLRAMAIPQLLGPALLILLVYLWDALNATTPSIRRDPRWRWQMGMLVLLSVVVIAWNMRLRA